MIYLEKVSEKTFNKIVKMKLLPGQEMFVSSNLYSLAQAWLYYEQALPFAIMNDDEPVGFLMLDWDEAERTAVIWRFMIAAEHQQKGYGRAAMQAAIELIKQSNKFDIICLSFVEDNVAAKKLYYSLGFRETGEVEDEEIVMTLPLTDDPKVGMTIADEDDFEEIKEFLDSERSKGLSLTGVFDDLDRLYEEIKNKSIMRFTIMGKIIGLSDGENTYIGAGHEKYYTQALEKIKERR